MSEPKEEWDEFNRPWDKPEKEPEAKPDKPQLHQSHMDTLSKCGYRYYLRYVRGIIAPPGAALHVGTGVHKAVQANMQKKLESHFQDLLPIDDVQGIAEAAVKERWDNEGCDLSDEEKDIGEKRARANAIHKAIQLAGVHHEELAPQIMPTHVERKWVINLEGYDMDLAGQIDIQEADSIRDTKTGSKSPVKSAADTSMQLTMYALAAKVHDGEIPERLLLDYCIQTPKKKRGYTKTLETFRDWDDIQVLLNRVQCYIENIGKGAFIPANTNDWVCTPRWCGYFAECPYSKNPVSVSVERDI